MYMAKLPWIVVVLLVVLAGYLGVRAQRAEDRAQRAEGILATQQRLADLAKDYQPAHFVRSNQTAITYRVPQQVEVGGQTFVQYVERVSSFGPVVDVFGPRIREDGLVALARLPEGTPISLLLTEGPSPLVEAVYVP
jgi:hypothetical protein